MKIQNPNCDGSHCISSTGETRWLPTGGDGNAILCRACFCHEMAFRRERNQKLSVSCRFLVPAWESLRINSPEVGKAIV